MEWNSGNIHIRPNVIEKAGDFIDGHKHNFDHTTIFFSGEFTIEATKPDGSIVTQDIVAPAHRLIKADVMHKITAKTDGATFWCVYSHMTPQGEVAQEYTGWEKAYY